VKEGKKRRKESRIKKTQLKAEREGRIYPLVDKKPPTIFNEKIRIQ
jgi:hypothetical protein